MAGVQRGLAPGGLPSTSPSIPLSSHRLRSRRRLVRFRPRWRRGGGPALGGQADRLGPAPDLEGDHRVGLQLPEPGVLLWGQVDAKGGRHVDGLMHGHLATWTRALPVEPHRYYHRDQPHCLQAG
jgi:hypothetical protein